MSDLTAYIPSYFAIASSLGAWVYAYARKDLSAYAYQQFDLLRDDLSEQLSLLDRRIERLETSFQHSEELQRS